MIISDIVKTLLRINSNQKFFPFYQSELSLFFSYINGSSSLEKMYQFLL